jgi:pyridoxamine 5'-phosphate oxidase family protein
VSGRVTLTDAEIAYLDSQRLGRLATCAPDGGLQNNPVSCYVNPVTRTIDIGGHNMGASRKYRNVQTNPQVAVVLDDLRGELGVPAGIRCLEIRGTAEAIPDPVDSAARTPGPIIRIHPRQIVSWGIGR